MAHQPDDVSILEGDLVSWRTIVGTTDIGVVLKVASNQSDMVDTPMEGIRLKFKEGTKCLYVIKPDGETTILIGMSVTLVSRA